MNAEQKERAIQLITTWRTRSITTRTEVWAVYGDCMTDILQELVDAPESEPVARVTGYYAGYLSIATVDGRVLPAGTALYLAPPAPGVPDGWKHDCAGIMQNDVELWIDSCPHCGKPKTDAAPPAPSVPLVLPEMSKNHIECIALDAGIEYCGDGVWRASPASMRDFAQRCINDAIPSAPTPAEAPEDVARDAWYGSNPPSLFQATAIYMALLEAAPNPQKLSDERILELFYEHATPDRWPFGFARAIDAAMSEKGGA